MTSQATYREEAWGLPIADNYDVIVCSSNPWDIPTARQDAKVVVLKRYGFVGRVATFSIVPCGHRLGDRHSRFLTEFVQRVRS